MLTENGLSILTVSLDEERGADEDGCAARLPQIGGPLLTYNNVNNRLILRIFIG